MAASSKPSHLRLYLEHTPSSHDPTGAPAFYQALGTLLVALGRLESHFLVCIMMIMATKATSGLAKKLPNAWDERKRIWKEAFRTSPALKPHEPDALKFLAELEDVAKDRHTIFHCSWERLNAGPPLNAKIAILRPTKGDKDSFDFSRETITINQVRGVAQKASRLNIELKPWSDLLSAQRGPLPAGIHEL